MRKVDQENTGERRRQVLAAALACFRRKGFAASTVAEICREAGMSPGHLYHYFKSKDEIVVAIAEQDSVVAATALERLAREDDIVAAVVGLSADDADVGVFAIDGLLAFEVYAEAGRNARVQAALRANYVSVHKGLAALLKQGQGRGTVDPTLDPGAAAVLVTAVYDGLTIAGRSDPELPTGTIAKMVPIMFERFLRGSAEAQSAPALKKVRVRKNVEATSPKS